MAEVAVEYRCFVGGLAWVTDDASLEEAFKPFGDVIESKVINDRETGKSRGFGFVTFREEESMKNAIESMNGTDLDGRNISVHQAQQRPSYNNNSRGGGRGGYNNNSGDQSGGGERGGYNRRGSGDGFSGGGGGGGGRRYGGARSDGRSDVNNWRRNEA